MPKKKNTRASNGMGSIRKRSDGRWEARYTTPDGRQRSVYGKTEKEVTAKLRGALHDMDSGTWREPSKITVAQWLDVWLADFQGDNSERTVIKYKSIVNHNIKPVIGDLKLVKLSPIHIRRLISIMQSRVRLPTGLGLKYLYVLISIIQYRPHIQHIAFQAVKVVSVIGFDSLNLFTRQTYSPERIHHFFHAHIVPRTAPGRQVTHGSVSGHVRDTCRQILKVY